MLTFLAIGALWTAVCMAEPPTIEPANERTEVIRPVDPVGRAQLGFAEPRSVETILAELDALTPPDPNPPAVEGPGATEAVEAWQRTNNARAIRRVSLISELEESGYKGSRLGPLLYTKLLDAAAITQHASTPMRDAMAVMWAMRDRYQGEPIGAKAALFSLTRAIHELRRAGLHVSEADLRAIADLEVVAARDPEYAEAGYTLMSALNDHPQAVKDTWMAWAEANLPADSLIQRTEARKRAFDRPIRLEGPGMDGGVIDTKDWLGSVVIVDFWGTWCGPCKAKMPGLARLKRTYGERGLRVVGIVVDRVEPARKYLENEGYDWPQIIAADIGPERDDIFRHPIAHRYAINSFPTVWLIDREGVLRKAPWDEQELEAKVVELLAKPAGGQ